MKKVLRDANILFENSLVNYSKNVTRKEYSAKEFLQMQNYIKNLEKTITINKEIIDQLCSQKCKKDSHKQVEIEKQRDLNLNLNLNLNPNEKDKLLNEIVEYKNIIKNLKNENEMLINEIKKIKIENNKKEAEIILENKKKGNHLEEIIEKLNIDLLHKEKEKDKEKGDGNSIFNKYPIENQNQNNQERINNQSETIIKNQEKNTNILMTQEKNSKKKSMPFIPTLDLSKVLDLEGINFNDYIRKLEDSIKILRNKIKDLEENNKSLAEKNLKLHNSNEHLRKINENLSLSLSSSKPRIQKGFLRKPIDHSKPSNLNLNSNSKIDLNFFKIQTSLKLSESQIINGFDNTSKNEKLISEDIHNSNSKKKTKTKKIGQRNDLRKLFLSESKSIIYPQNGQIGINNSVDDKSLNLSIEKCNIKLEN